MDDGVVVVRIPRRSGSTTNPTTEVAANDIIIVLGYFLIWFSFSFFVSRSSLIG